MIADPPLETVASVVEHPAAMKARVTLSSMQIAATEIVENREERSRVWVRQIDVFLMGLLVPILAIAVRDSPNLADARCRRASGCARRPAAPGAARHPFMPAFNMGTVGRFVNLILKLRGAGSASRSCADCATCGARAEPGRCWQRTSHPCRAGQNSSASPGGCRSSAPGRGRRRPRSAARYRRRSWRPCSRFPWTSPQSSE